MHDTTHPTVLSMNRNAVLAGAEKALLVCMEEARRHGYHTVLACPGTGPLPDATRAMGLPVIPCPFEWLKRTRSPAMLAHYLRVLYRGSLHVERICREHQVAILHPHVVSSALYGTRAAHRVGVPLIYHVHDAMPPNAWIRAATRHIARHATYVVCSSQAVRRVQEGIGVPARKLRVIYSGLDNAFLGTRPEPTDEVQGPGPHIGLVGMIVPWKGQDIFLKAAARLAERFPSATFYIIGSLIDEEAKPFLKRIQGLASASPLAGRVVFTGFRNDIPRWMMAMDVVVNASVREEALPTVHMEALALGRRMVAVDLGGSPEVIEHGVTGLLVPPSDPEALATAISDLLARPPDDPMGARGAASIRARFAPERIGRDLAALYGEALEGGGHPKEAPASEVPRL